MTFFTAAVPRKPASNQNEEQMDNSIRSEIEDVADEVLDLAERLVSVGEKLNRLNGTSSGQVSDEAWMASAKAELDELIRSVGSRFSSKAVVLHYSIRPAASSTGRG